MKCKDVECKTLPNQSYLIQRLLKPRNRVINGVNVANLFAFGGGLRNGGLTNEAMDLLKDIFEFDYMGAAEFEFGEVPKALSKIANDSSSYIGFEYKTKYNARDYSKREDIKGKATVYVICKEEWKDDVCNIISHHALSKHNNLTQVKESTHLNFKLSNLYNTKVDGWLELDNGYFFFTDKEMFEKTCKLFNISIKD